MRKWKTWMCYINLWTFQGSRRALFVQWFTAMMVHLRDRGVWNAKRNISLWDKLKINNHPLNKRLQKNKKTMGKTFKQCSIFFCSHQTSKKHYLCVCVCLLCCRHWSFKNGLRGNQHGNNEYEAHSITGLVELWWKATDIPSFPTDALIPLKNDWERRSFKGEMGFSSSERESLKWGEASKSTKS